MEILTFTSGLGRVVLGQALADPPGEDVADRALARLVAVQPGDDAAVDDAADAGDVSQEAAVHDVAGRGAHDREHLAGVDSARGGGGAGPGPVSRGAPRAPRQARQ